jgi:hypothetical protein
MPLGIYALGYLCPWVFMPLGIYALGYLCLWVLKGEEVMFPAHRGLLYEREGTSGLSSAALGGA